MNDRKYWRTVFCEAFKAARGTKFVHVAIGWAITITFSFFVHKYTSGTEEAMTELSAVLSYGLISIIIVPIMAYVYHLFKTPAKIHYKQREQLAKWEPEKIKTDKITIEPKTDMMTENFGRAWIEIYNGEELDLDDSYADLKSIKTFINQEWLDWTEFINLKKAKLQWASFAPSEKKIIRRKTPEIVDIAETFGNDIVLIFEGKKERKEISREFKIEIEINGIINEKPIEPLSFQGQLSYRVHQITYPESKAWMKHKNEDGEWIIDEESTIPEHPVISQTLIFERLITKEEVKNEKKETGIN